MPAPIYLEAHPPAIPQYRRPRRATPSGVIVVHTAESILDTIGPDTGAEAVAKFIEGRDEYGSYHRLSDSDSTVRLVAFDAEAYGDGTGSNPHAIHISFACRTTDWVRMSRRKRRRFLRQGAQAAAEAAEWLREHHHVNVPARRITREQSEQRVPGFISHGQRDPERRTDPGADFPWDEFLELYKQADESMKDRKRARIDAHLGDAIGDVQASLDAATRARRQTGKPRRPLVRSTIKKAKAAGAKYRRLLRKARQINRG